MADDRLTNPQYVWNQLDYEHDALIEASAGTGKTYALESIVLKLVEEKGYDATSILLVTFTEKAAGELKDRIRKALENAKALPDNFDEMTIGTIHSFCRQLLSEYAFENGVPIKSEIGGDSDALVHKAVLEVLLDKEFCDEYQGKLFEVLEDVKIKSVAELIEEVQGIVSNTSCAKLCASMESAIVARKTKKGTKDIRRKELLLKLVKRACARFEELKNQAALLTFDDMVVRAAEVVTRVPLDEGEKSMQRRFFDSIRERYRVALVDEFQDTDAHQWDIFRTLFSSSGNKVEGRNLKPGFLLVVGDPKQAIYSFRGADVKVYCAARDKLAGQKKSLDETFRSKKTLIDAFNVFFRDADDQDSGSDWFKNGVAGAGIDYKDVFYPRRGNRKFDNLRAPMGEDDAVLLLESMPTRISPSAYGGGCFGNKASCLPEFMEHAVREMIHLKGLNPAYWTREEGAEERMHTFSYGDMCVLVETNNDAAVVRSVLAKYGIPYGQYKQQGLYESAEAEGVLALLDYLARPNGSGNRPALLISPIIGVHPSKLSKIPRTDASAFDKFIEGLQKLAADKEWNKLFERVMSDPCTALVRPAGDLSAFNRTRAAVRQIFDALLAEVGGIADSVSEFAAVLREWRKNDKAAGEDGPLFKKESEADRVQIMTMHASKGLQFPIVFIAYGFSNQIKKGTPKEEEPAALEERRRLLYVALTRAEYRLYLPWSKRAWKWIVEKTENTKGENGKVVKDANGNNVTTVRQVPCSGIGSVGSALLVGDDPVQTRGFLGRAIQVYFEGKENSAFAPDRHLPGKQTELTAPHLVNGALSRPPFDGISIPGLKSRRVQWDSFSSIPQGGTTGASDSQKTIASSGDPQQLPEPHDPTVKAKTSLPRSNVSGNVFHEIMETLCKNDADEGDVDFTTACDEAMQGENSPLRELIRKAMNKNQLVNREVGGTTTEAVLLRMVQNVLSTPIRIGETEIVLKDIEKKNRLAEVEFVASEQQLLSNLPEDREGAMNGKIDLLVRVGDKVFVLDWKTNSLSGYEEVSTRKAMDEAGYHLQYKIYSLAASEWVKPYGLTIGGVAYLFVRGGEVSNRCGVFARVFAAADIADFREEISNMGYFAGKKEDA